MSWADASNGGSYGARRVVHPEVYEIDDSDGEDKSPLSCLQCSSISLVALSSLALFIIGAMAAAGAFPSPHLGYIVLGLGGGAALFTASNALEGGVAKRVVVILTALSILALPAILGSLGAAGILTNVQLGWGLVGSVIAGAAISIPILCCAGCCACAAVGGALMSSRASQEVMN